MGATNMSGISFSIQNEVSHAAAAAANDRLFNDVSTSKLFTSGNPSASAVPNVMTPTNSNSIINTFGQAFLNQSLSSAILAAQEGNDRVSKLNATLNTTLQRPAGDLSSQVRFDGSLGVNFGSNGAPMGGGYSFKSGADLKTAFQVAVGSKLSEGEAVDTVSMVGNTMTGSTSGANAHDVFTLSLDPVAGTFHFQLLAPIDTKTTKGSFSSVFLQGLFQAKDAIGTKMSIPTVELDIYNDYGSVNGRGNWALLHEGSLTYQDPTAIQSSTSNLTSDLTGTSSSSSGSKTYTPPTDPRTFHGYTTSTSAALGVINSVNIFS
jgi:hypothetical protein